MSLEMEECSLWGARPHSPSRSRRAEGPMGTIEIHEPEVKEVKPAGRPGAVVLPRKDVEQAFTPRVMFSDSLLDFGQARKRKAFATTTSFIFNCVAIGLMLVIPLMFTDELPKAQLLTFLVAPPPPPPPPPPAAAQVQKIVHQIQTDMLSSGALRTPTKIPTKVQMIKEDEAPPPMAATGGVVGGVPGGIPGGQMGGVIRSVFESRRG